MRRLLVASVLLGGSAVMAAAQAAAPTQSAPLPTIRTGTQIVVVDVTVQDRAGRPVRGLAKDSFILQEDRKPQSVRHFEEHAAGTLKPGPELPPMPPGTFSNYTPVPAGGSMNILLIDSLNTPLSDQSYLRQQLAEYAKKAKPGQNTAVFGLAQHLFLLQGFSSEPKALRETVQHKLMQRQSVLLDGESGGLDAGDALSDSSMQDTVASAAFTQFQAEATAFQTQLRVQYTLDAFNALAHYLQAFPGRKNLIWFSGSFPINILPDDTLANPFSVMNLNEDEFRETTNLLARSQVAVYPVDARGLMTDPAFSAAQSGRGMSSPQALTRSVAAFSQSQAQEHMTMDQLAEDTGGRAFYNNNDLAGAVASAVDSGANYYTLAYTPENRNWNGSYRSIRVTLAPELARNGYKLAFRHGYYAVDPTSVSKKGKTEEASAVTSEEQLSAQSRKSVMDRTAMAHGAPTPEDILFKVRVLPLSTTTTDKLAAGNQGDPLHPMKPPFRDFLVDYAVPGSEFKITKAESGRYTGDVGMSIFVYDRDGKLLNVAGSDVKLNLTPETYAELKRSVRARFVVSVPVKVGETFLRIGVRDGVTDKYGVVELPTAPLARLAPPADLPPANVPSSAPAAPPAK